MTMPLSRFRIGALILGVILLVALAGYRAIGQRGWIDAAYMVVITVSSVGYTDAPSGRSDVEKVFTILVIVFGMSAAGYTLGGLLQKMTEGEIQRVLGLRRISKEIQRLSDHVVICGFGRTGRILAEELQTRKKSIVIIDQTPEHVAEAQQQGYLALNGDATEEEVLVNAGVPRAKTLVTAIANDVVNVYITLTSRNLNANLQIIARGEFPATRKKLIQAGADRVVLPAAIGAQRMAAMITRPSIVELLELVTGRGGVVDVEMDELTIPANNRLVGQTVQQIEARKRHGLLVVAVKRAGGDMVFNPDDTMSFVAGDTIIVMGRVEDTDRFRSEYDL